MKLFINRFLASILAVCLMGIMPLQAQTAYSYQWQDQQFGAQKNNSPEPSYMVEDPLAELIQQADDIREALLAEDETVEKPLIGKNEFKNIYKEEVTKAYQQAKQKTKSDPKKLEQIEKRYRTMSSESEINEKWNNKYKARFGTMSDSQDLTETEKELHNFQKRVMDAYEQSKTQNLLDIIIEDFPLYASMGGLDSSVRKRARAVLRGIVSNNAPRCKKSFSAGACNKAIQAASSLAILGDFNDSKRTDLIPLETLLTNAYEGPLAYSAVFLAAGALLTAGQTGAIKSLLVDAANDAKEKQEELLGGPLFMPSTWINAVQSDGGDSYYLTGYENMFYDISSLEEGSGCVLTDLGEYFAEEAATGNTSAKEILNAIAGLTIQATPFRANRLMDVQMAPFWAGAIGGGYIVHNMGYRGTALDENGTSSDVDTVQYWNDVDNKLSQRGTDYTGYIAYQLYTNKKAAVNAWTALYANNHLAAVIQEHYPNKQAAVYSSPTSGQMSRVETQQVFLNVIGPVSDFLVEWALMDMALTGGLSTAKSIGNAVTKVNKIAHSSRAVRLRYMQTIFKNARAGLSTKLSRLAAQAKTPQAAKKIQRLRKAVLRNQQRIALRTEIYTAASTQLGLSTQMITKGTKGVQTAAKGAEIASSAGRPGKAVSGTKNSIELSGNAHINPNLGLQKQPPAKSLIKQAPVKKTTTETLLPAAKPTKIPASQVEIPTVAPADAVPTQVIEGKLSGPLDQKLAKAKLPYEAPKTQQMTVGLTDDIMSATAETEKSGGFFSKLFGKKKAPAEPTPAAKTGRLDEQTKQAALQKMRENQKAIDARKAAQAREAEKSGNAMANLPVNQTTPKGGMATTPGQAAQNVSQLSNQTKRFKKQFNEIADNLDKALANPSLTPAQQTRIREAERYFSQLTPAQADDWTVFSSAEFQKHASVLRSPTATEHAIYVEGGGLFDSAYIGSYTKQMELREGFIPQTVGNPEKGFVRSDLQQAFRTAEKTDKPLLVQISSHGELDAAGKFYIPSRGLTNSATMRTADLVDDLQMLRRTTGAPEINLQLDACHSGAFLQEFESLPEAKRVGINIYAHAGAPLQENEVFLGMAARSRGTGSIAFSQSKVIVDLTNKGNVFARAIVDGKSFNPLEQALFRAQAEGSPLVDELELLYRLQNTSDGTEAAKIMAQYNKKGRAAKFSRGSNFRASTAQASNPVKQYISDTGQQMLSGKRWEKPHRWKLW